MNMQNSAGGDYSDFTENLNRALSVGLRMVQSVGVREDLTYSATTLYLGISWNNEVE